MKNCVIGIDAGGTMTKAALFDFSGHELACARRKNVMTFPHPGWTERDPDRRWNAAAEALREVLDIAGRSPGDVAAVSVAGWSRWGLCPQAGSSRRWSIILERPVRR